MESVTANTAWLRLLNDAIAAPTLNANHGVLVGQTDKYTNEIIGATEVVDMRYPVVTVLQRKLSYKFMFAEALWIISGSNLLADIAPWCPAYNQFSDDGVSLSGAYGPRVLSQLNWVVATLEHDRNSRQAVMTMWDRRPARSKDIPCTVSTQFLIRGNLLHLIHDMRSSDIWLGWPYDIFSFSMVALKVILMLRETYPDLELGNLHFRAGSQHIYHRDLQKACQISGVGYSMTECHPISALYFKSHYQFIEFLQRGRQTGIYEYARPIV